MTCEALIESYLAALKAGFHCSVDSDDRLCVVTPYLYPDHDLIEVFVRERADTVAVSDLGETLRQLDSIGMDVCNTPRLKYMTERIAGGFHVALEGGVLVKRGNPADIGKLMMDVISAVKLVSSLAYGNRAYEPIGFDDEVKEYATASGITLDSKPKLTGRSGTSYTVSFKARAAEREYLIETISPKGPGGIKPKVDAAFRMWSDLDVPRGQDAKITLLNDDPLKFKSEDLTLLGTVSRVHRWTERQALVTDLLKPA